MENTFMSMLGRRKFLSIGAAAGAGALALSGRAQADDPPQAREMARFPEKTDLYLLTDRPPQLETPLKYFREDLTPNEAFFVRWHLAGLRTNINAKAFRLLVGGHLNTELKLSLRELRENFEAVSVVAVNQCSGNSRGFFDPAVPGTQWGNGAMGNARWTGVRLKDILAKAGLKAGAVDVSFKGMDIAPLPQTPNFVKALSVDRANDGEVLVAYQMNGADLPMLNGYPLRLVVPGWYSTYWIKSLREIEVLNTAFSGFWMDKAYRIPDNKDALEDPAHLAEKTVPISRMSVRSIFVFPEPQVQTPAQTPMEIEGVAFDGGNGIKEVELSADSGATWAKAELRPSLGNYSWRRWKFSWQPRKTGTVRLLTRATNNAGETQLTAQWNRSGYQRKVIEHLDVTVI
ncbi:MAG TPA: molybdopterin-dependent oxidoreductase [Planctomycetota bacterium]|nr:molybdopterin-dependent oxidoreductase [Planctomycetota bacterium]